MADTKPSFPPLETVSTGALAYLGDCVIELQVRQRLVAAGISSSKRLNEEALHYVRAGEQARAMERILPYLTAEESAAYHRGRNIGHANLPKNATMAEYRHATGMEALFGMLHLQGQNDRIAVLFALAYPENPKTEEKQQ